MPAGQMGVLQTFDTLEMLFLRPDPLIYNQQIGVKFYEKNQVLARVMLGGGMAWGINGVTGG